jgi:streptogramin lyase
MVSGTAIDANGTVYIADFFNNAIRRIDPRTGIISTVAGEIPTSPVHCC